METTLTIPTGRTCDADPTADRLAELFDRHQQRLFALAYRLTSDPDDPLDLVQDTFLRVVRRGRLRAQPGAERYLVRVLVNLCRDRWRKQAVRRRAGALAEPRIDVSQAEPVVERTAIRAALTRLSPRRRVVIVLHEIEGRNSREIAELLGIGAVTVRWHLRAARQDLKRWRSEDHRHADRGALIRM